MIFGVWGLGFGFWGLNVGMALMVILDLFPSGVLQLWDSMQNGYWHARELTYLMSGYALVVI